MDFRVSICLSRYYNDERSYCYIYIDETFGTIGGFEKYLRQQFRLKNNLCLMIDNNLLPNDQNIKILRPEDTITVVPLQKNWWEEKESEPSAETETNINEPIDVVDSVGTEKLTKKKKKKKSKLDAAEPVNGNEEDTIPLKNEKCDANLPMEGESSKKKDACMDVTMGSDTDREIEQINGFYETQDTTNDNSCDAVPQTQEPQKVAEMQSAIQQLKLKALSLLNEVATTQKPVAGVSGGRINKRKRIRKRNKNSLSVSTPDLTDSTSAQPITFKPVIKSASHIRFENDLSPSSYNTLRNSEITTKPRIIHAIETGSATNSRRPSVCDSPLIGLSSNLLAASQNGMNGNAKIDNSKTFEPDKNTISIENLKKRLIEFPVMDNVYPVAKDLVLFKMLKMGSDYTPHISDYILATVLEVDKPNDVIKASIVDGQNECTPVKGKFDLESAEETSNVEDTVVDITWSQVTEPRLIFP